MTKQCIRSLGQGIVGQILTKTGHVRGGRNMRTKISLETSCPEYNFFSSIWSTDDRQALEDPTYIKHSYAASVNFESPLLETCSVNHPEIEDV